jgi:hypothetical protein
MMLASKWCNVEQLSGYNTAVQWHVCAAAAAAAENIV